jgi:spermidine synthase
MKLKNNISFLQKILSYFISIELDKSDEPYYLELILDRNKLVLNSLHANQSNLNLKFAFNDCFHRLDIYKKTYNQILILGLGLGSVIDLLEENTTVDKTTAYENDSRVIAWLEQYYDIGNLEIINESVLNIELSELKYDLIIVDVFQDDKMPDFLFDILFWNKLKSSLTADGTLIWNTLKSIMVKDELETEFSMKDNSYSENRFFIFNN